MKKKNLWKEFLSIYNWKEIKKGVVTVTLVSIIIFVFYMLNSLGFVK